MKPPTSAFTLRVCTTHTLRVLTYLQCSKIIHPNARKVFYHDQSIQYASRTWWTLVNTTLCGATPLEALSQGRYHEVYAAAIAETSHLIYERYMATLIWERFPVRS